MSFLLQKEMQEKATFIHMSIFAVSPSIASCRIQTQSTTSNKFTMTYSKYQWKQHVFAAASFC